MLADFDALGLFEHGPIVEYTLGIPTGVFMVIREDDAATRDDLRYLKMGDGPHYLLYRPHVLVHYAAPLSAAEAVLYGTATITPRGEPVAEVATFAKRDLRAGDRLDGIGGFDTYGLIASADDAQREHLLPGRTCRVRAPDARRARATSQLPTTPSSSKRTTPCSTSVASRMRCSGTAASSRDVHGTEDARPNSYRPVECAYRPGRPRSSFSAADEARVWRRTPT